MIIKTKDWDYRNCWPLNSGELAVRPALVPMLSFINASPTTTDPSTYPVGCHSVRNPRTGAMFHYILFGGCSETGYTSNCKIQVYDENMSLFLQFNYGTRIVPRTVTFATIENEIMISSPDLPTVWGYIGAGLQYAGKVQPSGSPFTAIEVPRGLCVAWGSRFMVASENIIYWGSPAGDLVNPTRVFFPENAVNPPCGRINGLYVSKGGALIVCSDTGVYALPEDMASVGVINASNVASFSKLTDYACLDYNTTCLALGRVWGLTRKGFRLVDSEGSEEITLDERVIARSRGSLSEYVPRISNQNWQTAKLYGGASGPYVTYQGLTCMYDVATGFKSWQMLSRSSAGTFNPGARNPCFDLSGLLVDNDGKELMVFSHGVCRMQGTSETGEDPINATGLVRAQMAGEVASPPQLSPVIRHVSFATDSPDPLRCQINGVTSTATVTNTQPVVGTDNWDTYVYQEPPIRSRRMSFAIRGDDLSFEIEIRRAMSRVPPMIDVVFKGPGKQRPID